MRLLFIILLISVSSGAQTMQDRAAFYYPKPRDYTISINATTLVVDASGEKIAAVMRVPNTCSLGAVGFKTGAVVQNQTIRVSFQDVDLSTGNPDGTVDQYRDISIADTDDNVWKETGLVTSDGTDGGSKRSVTKNDYIAIVWEHQTFNSGDVFRIGAFSTSTVPGNSAAYNSLYTASWAKQFALAPIVTMKCDDGNVYYGNGGHVYPWSNVTGPSFNSGTASGGDERGNRFNLPFPAKAHGAWVSMGAVPSGNYDVVLYGADGTTALATVSTDKDLNNGVAGGFYYHFASPVSLTASTNYFLMVKPTSASNVGMYQLDVNAAALMDQVDGGQNIVMAVKTDGGSPTVTTTSRMEMGLIFSAFSDGAGSGSGGSSSWVQ